MASTESLVWSASALVVAAIVLPYFVAFRRRGRGDRARKLEAVQLGIDQPKAQFPFVDPARCIGCGACTAACPEGDVLGVVGGTATVVNGLRCVGHGLCAEACPVGAIEVGLGDLKSRADVPRTDEAHETDVPGLFIVGELGGLALVRNAVGQARRAVDRIAARIRQQPRTAGDVFDVLVVGAGPAGLAAAASARERGLSHAVLEQERDLGGTIFHYPRRKLVLVQPLEIPLWGRTSKEEYSKEELLAILQELVQRNQLNVRFGQKAVAVEREGGVFAVRSEAAQVFLGRTLVLALGRRGTPRKLDVPGEQLPKVTYQLLDAESYRGQRLLVVGGGDSAVEAAIGLARQPGNQVTLSYRREKLVRIKKKNEDRLAELLARRQLRALLGSQVTEILPDRVRLQVGERQVELPNDYVFVFAGGEPPFEFLRRMGVRFGGPAAAGPATRAF